MRVYARWTDAYMRAGHGPGTPRPWTGASYGVPQGRSGKGAGGCVAPARRRRRCSTGSGRHHSGCRGLLRSEPRGFVRNLCPDQGGTAGLIPTSATRHRRVRARRPHPAAAVPPGTSSRSTRRGVRSAGRRRENVRAEAREIFDVRDAPYSANEQRPERAPSAIACCGEDDARAGVDLPVRDPLAGRLVVVLQ